MECSCVDLSLGTLAVCMLGVPMGCSRCATVPLHVQDRFMHKHCVRTHPQELDCFSTCKLGPLNSTLCYRNWNVMAAAVATTLNVADDGSDDGQCRQHCMFHPGDILTGLAWLRIRPAPLA